MPIEPNMNLDLPTDHASNGVWGAKLNTALTTVGAHDHTPGKGVPVPAAALRINADVAWTYAGNPYAITGSKALGFTPVEAGDVASYANAFFVNDDSDLYFRNAAGTNVQITDGNQLNVSIVGGIGGDYAAVGALVSYDDATDSYWFKQQGGPRPWARLRAGDLDLYEVGTGATRVRLQSPAALAASYALTMPAALPAATSMLQVGAAGDVTATNALSADLALTGVLSPPALPAGNTADYNPSGLATASVIRLSGAATAALTGLAGGVAGRVVTLLNVGVNSIALQNDDGIGSTASNRFTLVNLALGVVGSISIRSNGSAVLWYDAVTARWRVIAQNL